MSPRGRRKAMARRFHCHKCGEAITVTHLKTGELAECKNCHRFVPVPVPDAEAWKKIEREAERAKASRTALRYLVLVGGSVLVALLLLIVTSTNNSPPSSSSRVDARTSAPTPTVASIVVSLATLVQAYEDNPIAADGRYKGRRLRVRGHVESIGRGVLGKPYVVLQEEDQYLSGVQFIFGRDQEDEDAVAHLRKGSMITIDGTCSGKALFHVVMDDVRIRDMVESCVWVGKESRHILGGLTTTTNAEGMDTPWVRIGEFGLASQRYGTR